MNWRHIKEQFIVEEIFHYNFSRWDRFPLFCLNKKKLDQRFSILSEKVDPTCIRSRRCVSISHTRRVHNYSLLASGCLWFFSLSMNFPEGACSAELLVTFIDVVFCSQCSEKQKQLSKIIFQIPLSWPCQVSPSFS